MNMWNMLPASIAARVKEICTIIGVIVYVVVSYIPSVAGNHYVAIAIGVLTLMGVYTAPKTVKTAPKA